MFFGQYYILCLSESHVYIFQYTSPMGVLLNQQEMRDIMSYLTTLKN
jgi:hypothetical protein